MLTLEIKEDLLPLTEMKTLDEDIIYCNVFDFQKLFAQLIFNTVKIPLKIYLPKVFILKAKNLEDVLYAYPDERFKFLKYFKENKYVFIKNNVKQFELTSKSLLDYILDELQENISNIHDLRKAFLNITICCECEDAKSRLKNFELFLKRC